MFLQERLQKISQSLNQATDAASLGHLICLACSIAFHRASANLSLSPAPFSPDESRWQNSICSAYANHPKENLVLIGEELRLLQQQQKRSLQESDLPLGVRDAQDALLRAGDLVRLLASVNPSDF
jgi:hypothetical protein